jgi:EAL domain-containing protein (putative c-di-GMP-specific phosphodiesterase class I)
MQLTVFYYAIADGVETEKELNFLRDLDCQDKQGFLLSRPQHAESINFMQKKRKNNFCTHAVCLF